MADSKVPRTRTLLCGAGALSISPLRSSYWLARILQAGSHRKAVSSRLIAGEQLPRFASLSTQCPAGVLQPHEGCKSRYVSCRVLIAMCRPVPNCARGGGIHPTARDAQNLGDDVLNYWLYY